MSAKVCRNVFPNLVKKRNLAAISLILIPEYGQSNAFLNSLICTLVQPKGSLKHRTCGTTEKLKLTALVAPREKRIYDVNNEAGGLYMIRTEKNFQEFSLV